MKYFVCYLSSEGLQKSDPFESLIFALKSAVLMNKMGCAAQVEDEDGNVV